MRLYLHLLDVQNARELTENLKKKLKVLKITLLPTTRK